MGRKRAKIPGEDRRARFAQEYVIDLNATQAAVRAGYATKSAHVTGSRLLSDHKVQATIEAIQVRRLAKLEITAERVLREQARIAFSDARKLWHEDGRLKKPHEWDDDTAAAIAGVETEERYLTREGEQVEDPQGDMFLERVVTQKVKRWDKGRALAELSQILGMGKNLNPADSGGLSITIVPHGARR